MTENLRYALYFLSLGSFSLILGYTWKDPDTLTLKAKKWGAVILGVLLVISGISLLIKSIGNTQFGARVKRG